MDLGIFNKKMDFSLCLAAALRASRSTVEQAVSHVVHGGWSPPMTNGFGQGWNRDSSIFRIGSDRFGSALIDSH